ncbi:MAG: radical SAM/SPASM domain-containing protein [Acidobacteriota bacterium]
MNLKINKYYLPDPSDTLAQRLRKRLTRRAVPSFPRTIQIQTGTGCNADCIFCPYGATYDAQPKGRMEDSLFKKIIDESARFNVRRISPYLMNEPFADKHLFERISYINKANPRAKVIVTSNGALLVPPVVERLLALGDGVHELYLSVQGIDKDSYEKTMRGNMDFDRTMRNIDYLVSTMRKRRLKRPHLWITMVDTEVIDAQRAVAYWKSRGISSKYTRLENRGGNIADADSFSHSHQMQYFSTCTRLFKQMYIMFNGDVVLCCTDYSREQILGNVRDKSLYEVWNGEVAMNTRRTFLSDKIGELPLCGKCKIDEEVEVEHRTQFDARYYRDDPHRPVSASIDRLPMASDQSAPTDSRSSLN